MNNYSNDFEARYATYLALGGEPKEFANIFEVDLAILEIIEQGIGGDFKTNHYMDADGRLIVERGTDGRTVISDEHENPIIERLADGTTKIFDAYQGERMTISAHGEITFQELTALENQVANNTAAIAAISISGGASTAEAVAFSDGESLATKAAKWTKKVRVDIVPNGNSYKFMLGEEELNFADLNSMLQESPDFVVFVHDNREHRCVRIELDGSTKYMEFTSPIIEGVNTKAQSFLVTSTDGTVISTVKRTDIINENKTDADALRTNVNDLSAEISELEKTNIEVSNTIGYELSSVLSIEWVKGAFYTDDGGLYSYAAYSHAKVDIEQYRGKDCCLDIYITGSARVLLLDENENILHILSYTTRPGFICIPEDAKYLCLSNYDTNKVSPNVIIGDINVVKRKDKLSFLESKKYALGINNCIIVNWKNGYYNPANGNYVYTTYYCCTPDLLKFNFDKYVLTDVPENISIIITYYNANKQLINSETRTDGTVRKINGAEYFTINIRTDDFYGNFDCLLVGSNAKKTIAWYGTSIPAGYPHQDDRNTWGYPNIIAKKLDTNILNFCVPNGIIRKTRANGEDVSPARILLSFTNPDSAINYQNSMLDLIGTANEPDLFVFDYGVNDSGEGSSMEMVNFDFSTFQLNTFLGSFGFVLRKLYEAKPKARVLILTHYSDDSANPASFGKDKYKRLNDGICELAKYWGIKVIDARSFVGWVNNKSSVDDENGINTISVNAIDGIHPASGNNLASVQILANLYYPIIRDYFLH